jgi:hypothetical protein
VRVLEVGSCCASVPQMYADALDTECMIFRDHPFITQAKKTIPFHQIFGRTFNHDIFNRIIRTPQALAIFGRYDVLHFHTSTLLPFKADLLLLNGQKKVMHYRGSEVRGALQHVRTRFDLRLVSTPDLLQYVPNAKYLQNPVRPIPMVENHEPHDPPLVIHAPSDAKKKGTETILKAIKELGDAVSFELVSNVSHAEALKRIAGADIVIDQITPFGAHGVLSVEAMYLGKPVLCSIHPKYYPDECPIIPVKYLGGYNPDRLVKQIRETLRSDLVSLGKEGHRYAHKYHNPAVVAGELLRMVNEI